MEICHRIGINSHKDAAFFEAVKDLGLQYESLDLPGKASSLILFDITESSPHWSSIFELIEKYGASDHFDTIFDDEEIRNADWLRLVSVFEQGYPQPESNWPIKQQSYKEVCQKCGIYSQNDCLRIKKEPHLGKKSFVSPIWVGEIFCTSEVITCFQAIPTQGFESWDVKIHKTNQPSAFVHQLYIPNTAAPGLLVDNEFKRVVCQVCGTVKYYPHMKGKMLIQRKALQQDYDFIKTHEWFGSGLIAYREILISNRIARLILDKKWAGIRLKVVEPV
jgi:hypothetical protein